MGYIKHFDAKHAHLFDEAFVGRVGFSAGDLVTLVVVCQATCTINGKKKLMRTLFVSISALGSSSCERQKNLKIPTYVPYN